MKHVLLHLARPRTGQQAAGSPTGQRAGLLTVAALCLFALLCLWGALPARADTPPLLSHAAWSRLDKAVGEMPFIWSRRYTELRCIAEDIDICSTQMIPLMQNLFDVTMAAQSNVTGLLLDMVPAQANVQELSYTLGMLEIWGWKLEPPLRHSASTAAALHNARTMLESIGTALEEMQANPQKRPIMEKLGQDFYDLYTLVVQRAEQLNIELDSVRSITVSLYEQIRTTAESTQAVLPEKWLAYYLTPRPVSPGSFSHLGDALKTMGENLLHDESFPSGLMFASGFNLLLLLTLWLASAIIVQTSKKFVTSSGHHPLWPALCRELLAQRKSRKLAFGVCTVAMLNSVVDTLPQLHEGIPYLVVQQLAMVVGLAIWARRSSDAPTVWALALPIITGQLLLHGDAQSQLVLLGMVGSLLLSLGSVLLQRPRETSGLRLVWLNGLLLGLIMTVMGFGRLVVPLLMLLVAVRATGAMLAVVNNSPTLSHYTLARTLCVPVFTLYLCLMLISFMVACPGFARLRNYWYTNAVPILGLNVTFGDAILSALFLLGICFVSNISRQLLENLSRRSRSIDPSAVPVLHVVINCVLTGIFCFFVMSSLGVDATSLAFIGGGVSIGVGLAAKTVLSNFFCGLVLIFSRMVRAGDMVEIDGVTGRVLCVNMRSTMIETLSESILLVPNENLLGSNVTNLSLNNLHIREVIHFSVGPDSNVDTTLNALETAAARVPEVLNSPPPRAYYKGYDGNYMNFILQIWAKDLRNRENTKSEVYKAAQQALAEHGVSLAMHVPPQLAVIMPKQE